MLSNAGGVLVSFGTGQRDLNVLVGLTPATRPVPPYRGELTDATIRQAVYNCWEVNASESEAMAALKCGGDRERTVTDDRTRTVEDGGAAGDPSETIHARGHENVTGTHTSTWELTSDDWLTSAGDCIVGIEADRTPAEFDPAFVAACRDADATIVATLRAGDQEARVTGRGDPDLTFEDDRSLVARTSDYVDDRTVMVGADAAAVNLDRDLVAALAEGVDLTLTLRVEP